QLTRLVSGSLTPFATPPEFPLGLNVTRLLEDREGNLWVGSTLGLYRLEPKQLTVYSCRDELKNDDVRAVLVGPDDTIWMGTAEGVSTLRRGIITNLPARTDARDREGVAVLLLDSQHRLWTYDTLKGLMVFAIDHWQTVPTPEGVKWLNSLYQDHQGRIW